jgi:hypothetical protein
MPTQANMTATTPTRSQRAATRWRPQAPRLKIAINRMIDGTRLSPMCRAWAARNTPATSSTTVAGNRRRTASGSAIAVIQANCSARLGATPEASVPVLLNNTVLSTPPAATAAANQRS